MPEASLKQTKPHTHTKTPPPQKKTEQKQKTVSRGDFLPAGTTVQVSATGLLLEALVSRRWPLHSKRTLSLCVLFKAKP